MKWLFTLLLALALSGCATRFQTPNATGHYVAQPLQCVPYARSVSGIALYGDAYSWWGQADPALRGSVPVPGAVLVLAQTPRMVHGHVAVVKRIIDPRQIDVTHSNWGSDPKARRIVYDAVRAVDMSPDNDWSQVKFWNYGQNNFGRPYAALGFIYKTP